MGLIDSSKAGTGQQKRPIVEFPDLPQDFFVVMRIALENTPWEPDDVPKVKLATAYLFKLLKFTNELKKIKEIAEPLLPQGEKDSPATDPGLPPSDESPPLATGDSSGRVEEPPTADAPEQKKNKPASGPLKQK